ncbi:hypothetical protein QWY99_09315 [Flavobacterium branchiarum]|uniref:Uncharacterized protein n=1 Tax=Flavobacterium branchiarum TaxID=1114870 RepID=A0ABV5FRE8_9FLAO|nr:hypothetical protein [Flavobacterium branchiarum]MDN3673247.1 hypothetical protein [Flavobacterium branchiarum]
MEKKLQIYKPENSFEIDKNLLIALFLWLLLFLLNFAKSIFPTYEESLNLLVIFVAIITFSYSLYFLTSNFFKCETANRNFSGYLVIDSDKITCDLDVYSIYEIEKISILSDYFRGKFNGNISAWERKRSNGVKNYIEIYKKNGEYKKYFFLQTKTEDIRIFSDELRTYYRFGKLGEQNYKNIVD